MTEGASGEPSWAVIPHDDLEVLIEMASQFLLCAAERIPPTLPDDMHERAAVIARVRSLMEDQ